MSKDEKLGTCPTCGSSVRSVRRCANCKKSGADHFVSWCYGDSESNTQQYNPCGNFWHEQREQPAPGEPLRGSEQHDRVKPSADTTNLCSAQSNCVPAQPEGGDKPQCATDCHHNDPEPKERSLRKTLEKERAPAVSSWGFSEHITVLPKAEPSSPPAPAGGARELTPEQFWKEWRPKDSRKSCFETPTFEFARDYLANQRDVLAEQFYQHYESTVAQLRQERDELELANDSMIKQYNELCAESAKAAELIQQIINDHLMNNDCGTDECAWCTEAKAWRRAALRKE